MGQSVSGSLIVITSPCFASLFSNKELLLVLWADRSNYLHCWSKLGRPGYDGALLHMIMVHALCELLALLLKLRLTVTLATQLHCIDTEVD